MAAINLGRINAADGRPIGGRGAAALRLGGTQPELAQLAIPLTASSQSASPWTRAVS